MRLLLDTHAVIWALADSTELSRWARSAVVDPLNEVYVSPASVWEVEIKRAIGKLDSPPDLIRQLEASGMRELPVSWLHAEASGRLPNHHRDPFDRLLIAQAMSDGLTIVTRDPMMARYGVQVLVA